MGWRYNRVVEYRLLGPLEVIDDGRPVDLGRAKEQALLAVLLLHANETVSTDRLVDELWGDDPPASAAKLVSNYVWQLRKALGGAIVTRPPGYAIAVSAGGLDVERFESLVERAKRQEHRAAAATLREALSLWRGPPLVGVPLASFAQQEAERLEDRRLGVLAQRIDHDLALGDHEAVIAELQSLVAAHPYREHFRAQLMIALYRWGRQANALEVYRDGRRRFADELGIEPSPALQRLEQAILNQDPALEAPAGIPQSAPARISQHLHAGGMGDEGRLRPAEAEESRIAARWQLRCLDAASVPVDGDSLVGRARELRDLVRLLGDSSRLVTLTGTGGTGKTRLALEVAAKVAHEFADGAFFVPLAGLREPQLVASAIASTLGVKEFAELRGRPLLLLVDNFEHLLEAAPVISALRAVAPQVTVLATSRAPLRIADEREYPLEPLAEADAVALLTERGRAVRPGFSPDDATREICRRLDGLPLALELAATQLRSLAPAALLDRLDPRLPMLTGGRRDAPERHRTLHATIAWSYDLLDRELQDLLPRLAVFGGTFSVGAAEAVAGATLDRLARLVEASLVRPRERDRFFMLETIREFAAGLLETDGLAEVRERHAKFFVGLAERANLGIDSEGPMDHQLVIPEHDNFRAALEWSLGAGRSELGLRLAVALDVFWVTADPVEGIRWLERLLAATDGVPGALAARALRVYGGLTQIAGDFDRAEPFLQQSLAEFRAVGEDDGAATCLFLLAISADRRGDSVTAQTLLEQSLDLYVKTGSRKGEAQVRGTFAARAFRAGEHERGLELIDGAIALAHDAGFFWWEKNELCFLAERLLELGRPKDAQAAAYEALQIATRIHDRVGQVDALAILAHIASAQAEAKIAGRIWGVIEAEAKRAPFPGWERTRRLHAGAILASDEFEIARQAGAGLTLQTAVDEVLEQHLE